MDSSRASLSVAKNGFYKNRNQSQPSDETSIAIDGRDHASFDRNIVCDGDHPILIVWLKCVDGSINRVKSQPL